MDQLTFNSFEELIVNQYLRRDTFFDRLMDPRRDIYKECGFPQTNAISATEYKGFYDREGVASRVVELYPEECWKIQPLIYETEDSEISTEFENSWKELTNSLKDESVFVDEQFNPVWEHLKRVDILSGIGHYGVLLLGINDGKDLKDPIAGFEDNQENLIQTGIGTEGQYFDYSNEQQETPEGEATQLLYLRAFDESLVEITRWEQRLSSKRYGQPIMYRITMHDPKESIQTGVGLDHRSIDVHWSRVIHVADNLLSSEVIGVPRMRPVINNLMNLQKLYHGSAEMYWQGAFPGITFEADAGTKIDEEKTKETIQNYMNRLQRFLALSGMSAKTLSPQVVDANNQVETQIDAICIKLGVPKRIFVGSERGELASTQDKDSWEERLIGRRQTYITPRIIKPFIDRLIKIGILPQPKEYYINWPDADNLSRYGKAQTASLVVDVLSKYIAGSVDAMISPMDFMTNILGFTQDEAEKLLETTLEHLKEANPDSENIIVGRNPKPPQLEGTLPPDKEDQVEEVESPVSNEEEEDEYGSSFVFNQTEVPKGYTLNKPFRTKGKKKFAVYTKNDKGNLVLVRFGDPNMEIKRDDPEKRKNFRARHGCDNPGPKWKAKYWSCKMWSKTPVSKITNEQLDWLTQKGIDLDE